MPDISMDSPVIPLAGLYLAGQSQKGRRFTGGESGKGMLAAGFAASSSDWAANQALSAANMSGTVSNSLAKALIGAGISRYGGRIPANRAMSRGIMYNVASEAFTELGADAGSLFDDIGGGNGNGDTSGEPVRRATASSTGSETVTRNRRSTGGGGLEF